MTLVVAELMPAGVYAGIGSRQTPPIVLELMEGIGRRLAGLGWVLRSGAAEGADEAFERGARSASGRCEIFLPWPGFNGRSDGMRLRPSQRAREIAAQHHPAWERLGRGPRELIARNTHQLLGDSCMDPVSFVVCWTPDGATPTGERVPSARTGGTGQAIRLAKHYDISLWNLQRPDHRELWTRLMTDGVDIDAQRPA